MDIVTDVFLTLQAVYGQGPSNHRTWTQQEGGDLGYLPDWGELMPLQIGCSHEIASPNSSMTVDEANPDLKDFMARFPHMPLRLVSAIAVPLLQAEALSVPLRPWIWKMAQAVVLRPSCWHAHRAFAVVGCTEAACLC